MLWPNQGNVMFSRKINNDTDFIPDTHLSVSMFLNNDHCPSILLEKSMRGIMKDSFGSSFSLM